jgi:hypothetical protein
MRIIREGTLPEKQLYTATCWKCTTEFEFSRIEATEVPDQRDGNYLRINCPLCKSSVTKMVQSKSEQGK